MITAVEGAASIKSCTTSEVTTSEVTNTTITNESGSQVTAAIMSTEVKEVKTTTTIFTTTTTSINNTDASSSVSDTMLSLPPNHTKPLMAPSGDCQADKEENQNEDVADVTAGDTKGEKPQAKVVSLQSLIPNVKASTLQVEDKSGALAKAATSGAKTVLVVNRDGGKVMLQVAAQPAEKVGDEVSTSQESSSTASSASG